MRRLRGSGPRARGSRCGSSSGQGSRRGRARAGAGSRAAGRAVPDARQMGPPQRRRAGPPPGCGRRGEGRDSGRGGGREGCVRWQGSWVPAPRLSETLWRRRGSSAQRTLDRHCPSAAGPAHCRHRPRPRPRPAHPTSLCGAPGAQGPAPEARSAGPRLRARGSSHSRSPLLSGLGRPADCSSGSAQLPARPRLLRRRVLPPGPTAWPGSDSLPGDGDRRSAPGPRLAGTAAEPARPLKGTGSLSSAHFPVRAPLPPTSSN